jgi:hypothetical protein
MFVVMGIGLITAGPAGGVTRAHAARVVKAPPVVRIPPSDRLRLQLNDSGATLRLPIPACPATSPGCVWMLYVNEPNVPGHPTAGTATGTSGTLTVAVPAGFCGLLQADALLGPAPWAFRTGVRRTVGVCPPGTKGKTVTPTTVPQAVTASLPNTGSNTNAKTDNDGVKLPFTGFDLSPLVLLGGGSVLAGLLLMFPFGDIRRRLRIISALGWRGLASGVRRTGAWLFGL